MKVLTSKMRRILHFCWIDEVVDDIKEKTKIVCDNAEKLRQQARIDGENGWFLKHSYPLNNHTNTEKDDGIF